MVYLTLKTLKHKLSSSTFETKFQVAFPSSALNGSVQPMSHSYQLLSLTGTRARLVLFVCTIVTSTNGDLIEAAATQS
jgi:hypothetical protein